MVYCAICNLNFFCGSFLQNVFGDKKCDRLVFVCFFVNVVLHETVNVISTANPGHIAQRLIGGDTP